MTSISPSHVRKTLIHTGVFAVQIHKSGKGDAINRVTEVCNVDIWFVKLERATSAAFIHKGPYGLHGCIAADWSIT